MRNYKTASLFVVFLIVLFSAAVNAGEFTVEQKDKQFMKDGALIEKISIKVGDKIHFRNQDPWFHNVFSLSDNKSFDLGSYPKGESKTVTFDKAGVAEVECAIHPAMFMEIEVK